jgi:predicted GNAT family N-acyltransferase
VIVRVVPFGSSEYEATLALRDEVLRRPLGLTLTAEDRAGEEQQWHLVALSEAELLGCLVLVPSSAAEVKMRQVAVALNHRREGVGKALVKFAEQLAQERGFIRMVLHARLEAVLFYERLGYSLEGAEFVEVTIPHRRMTKTLRP